jgi:hypothetical protein
MTGFVLVFLGVAVVLAWWVIRRAARLRRETESREAQVLEALFAARRAKHGNGGETIDVERIFGRGADAAGKATSADAVLRAAGLEAELIALVRSPPPGPAAPAARAESLAEGIVATAAEDLPTVPSAEVVARKAAAQEAKAREPVPVRDLVQIFYEARGYRVVPASRNAAPIELVLRHKTDPLRSYAFVPLAGPVTEADARALLERARSIDQPRVLIATEGSVAPEVGEALAALGIRVLDRAGIEAHLAPLDFATAAKIRAVARRRASRRQQADGAATG